MATHEERIQALEDFVYRTLRWQEMIVEALGEIIEDLRDIARTQQEHTAILREHMVLLRSIVATARKHSLKPARIRWNMEMG
ncbi:MAG: hypothetical protein OYI31_04510 [Chloroflexota bacterium]|nr:hypothetical protein [Chloroflexota bacterium]MDE2942238.1 hypothetical protein [Chloroflexota bacterium]MDE3267705.1 hypothetical protein [Chloroflexota bacterium]